METDNQMGGKRFWNQRTIDDPESCLYSAIAVTPPIRTFGSCTLGKNTSTGCILATACVYDTVVLFGDYHGKGLTFDLVGE